MKQSFEDIIRFYFEARGLKTMTLVLYDTYGAGDPRKKIVNLFHRIAASGEPLSMSGGDQYIDLIYIDDIVDAYLLALDQLEENDFGPPRKYYLHSSNPMRLKDVATVYENVMQVKLNIIWGARPYRARENMETYSEGQLLPGWKPRYTVDTGLRLMKARPIRGVRS